MPGIATKGWPAVRTCQLLCYKELNMERTTIEIQRGGIGRAERSLIER